MTESTLGEIALGVSIAVSFLSTTILVAVAFGSERYKYFWWLFLSTTVWLWFPFVVYGMYYVGSATVGAVDRLNRNDIVVPARPKVQDMNKVQPEAPAKD